MSDDNEPYEIGVHRTHCCKRHGCKYGQAEVCCVMQGTRVQAYLCEYCTSDDYDGKGVHYEAGIIIEKIPENEVEGLAWLPGDAEVLEEIKQRLAGLESNGWRIKEVY